MKTRGSLLSKIERDTLDMTIRQGSNILYSRDCFRMRVYLKNQNKHINYEDVDQILSILLNIKDEQFELLRVKDKVTTDEWPIEFILN